jgi:hypothetical protein
MRDSYFAKIRGFYWRVCDVIAGRMPRCNHGFAPDQGIGLWCRRCDDA